MSLNNSTAIRNMIDEFKTKFGDKWNNNWFVQEVGDFCDEFVNTPGDNKYLARFFDYTKFIETVCYEDDYTIWTLSVKNNHPHNRQSHDVEVLIQVLPYKCKPYPGTRYNNDGNAEYFCELNDLYLITNADLDLLDNNSGKIAYADQ